MVSMFQAGRYHHRWLYWVSQKVPLGFFIPFYGKTQRNFFTNPIDVVAREASGNVSQNSSLPVVSAGPANICLPNNFLPIAMQIAFLPFAVPNHYPHLPLFSWTENVNQGENLSHFSKLLSLGSLLCIHVNELLFDFLLWICLMAI